jgi:hypothetical protein
MKRWQTKKEIALYFGIGERTVSKLMYRRIFPHHKLRNLVRFDLAECDSAFDYFKVPSLLAGSKRKLENESNERHWKTKIQIAVHCRISERTITNLMRQRILPFVKLGRLVRFDLDECDCALDQFRIKSILSRHFQPQSSKPEQRSH